MESQLTPLTLLHFLMSDVFMAYFKRAEFWHRTGYQSPETVDGWRYEEKGEQEKNNGDEQT